MKFSYRSRIFAEFNFLDKMMFPIAIKGIPLATILRIFAIIILVLSATTGTKYLNYLEIRNIHIIVLFAIVYTILIYTDDSYNSESYGVYIITFFVILFNLFVIFDLEPNNRRGILEVSNTASILFLSFSFLSIKDNIFYANYLRYSRVPNNEERVFAFTKALIYSKSQMYSFEYIKLIKSISALYEHNSYPKLAAYTSDLASMLEEIISRLELIETRRVANTTIDFDDLDSFKLHIEVKEKELLRKERDSQNPEDILKKVEAEIPEGPWEKDLHKIIAKKLGISINLVNKCIDKLIEDDRIRKPL